jgi:hypothetical protein
MVSENRWQEKTGDREKGLLIPREVLGGLDKGDLEAIREEDQIVIRLKSQLVDERAQVEQVLRAAGLLYELDWEQPSPVSEEERARLARKLASGSPLSEMIIADREDRA